MKSCVKTNKILGYNNEWEVFQDKYGNLFYKNLENNEFEWEMPLDAVNVEPAEKLCTSHQVCSYAYFFIVLLFSI
jgi:hypothetical protein